jgi:hypothetical protein
VAADPESLVVKPEIASARIEAEQTPTPGPITGDSADNKETKGRETTPPPGRDNWGTPVTPTLPLPPVLRRFHGSVALNSIRAGNDVSKIGVEVLSHLAGIVGADVQVTLDIQAVLPEGASDKLVRDVTENCRTLGFKDYGFEEY